MEKLEAEKLLCPFIKPLSHMISYKRCETDKCMAWELYYDYYDGGNRKKPNGEGVCKLISKN